MRTLVIVIPLAALLVWGCSQAGPPLPQAAREGTYQVVHGWPVLPNGFALGQATGVDVDSHNHVLVFHRGDRPILMIEGDTGEIVNSWGDGMFSSAHGLTVDSQDNVWVTDNGHHQVFKFSHEGKLLMTLGEQDTPGLDEKHFNGPTDIAVTPTGEAYISDGYGNNRVRKFSADGKFLFDWGSKGTDPGNFDIPHGIAIDSQGRLYVADRQDFSANGRVQVFNGDGEFLDQWKSPGLARPWGMTVGADNYLYLVDGGDFIPNPPKKQGGNGRGRILKMTLKGEILEEWGSFGSHDGQFYWPHDVGVGRDGAAYVVDVNVGMRVQKFVRK